MRRARAARLLAPAVLLAACAGPFVMPPAKTRRAGLQITSTFAEGLALVRSSSDLRTGYMDRRGNVVVAPRFFAAGAFSQGLAPAQEEAGGGWGFVDRTGRFVIEPAFDAALPFSEGLAPVRRGDLWGFVDRAGVEVVPPRFHETWGFVEGRARAVMDGLVGYVDPSGTWVVEPGYFRAGDFHEGLAFACERSLCGFVDRSGAVVVEPRYDDAGSFSQGLAPVRVGARWGYVDRAGQMAIAPVFDQAQPFAEGLARVSVVKDASFDPKFGGYSGRAPFSGFIDARGQLVLETVMLGATSFAEGLTVVRLPSGGLCSDCSHYRLMDRDGDFLPGRFDQATSMSDGVAVVAVGEHSYVIDADGVPLVSLDHSIPQDPSTGARNAVRRRWGFVDAQGRAAIPHVFVSAQPFSEGLAFVEGPWDRAARGRVRGWVDRAGVLTLPVADWVAQALPFTDGLALVSRFLDGSSRYGFMDRAGALAIPARYARAAPFQEGLAAVKLSRDVGSDDWGYVDRTGRVVIEPRFHSAGSFSRGLAYVERVTDRRILVGEVIDSGGRVVIESPFLPEVSRMLLGTPSLDQLRQRRAVVFGDGLVPVLEPGFRGWVDPAGRRVAARDPVAHLGLFSEGRAPVGLSRQSPVDGPWGFADLSGRVVVGPGFATVQSFSEGLAGVRDVAGRWGYATPAGEWAIPPTWLEEAGPFAGGRALVKLNGRWGYLDRGGRFAIPPRYVRAEPFSDGLAATAVAVSREAHRPRRSSSFAGSPAPAAGAAETRGVDQ